MKLLIIFAVNGEVVRSAHSEVENSVFSEGLILLNRQKNTTITAEGNFTHAVNFTIEDNFTRKANLTFQVPLWLQKF